MSDITIENTAVASQAIPNALSFDTVQPPSVYAVYIGVYDVHSETVQVRKSDRALSTDAVVDAALRLADAEGLEAVSLRRLASELRATPMALYRHVRDKDDLLDLMAGRLLDELDVSTDATPTWQEALRRLGSSFLDLVAAHPAAPFLLSRPFDSPGSRRLSVAFLGILDRAGFETRTGVAMLQALTGMLLGPSVHRATYAAAAARKRTRKATDTSAPDDSEPEWPLDIVSAWAAGAEADRLVVEIWVAGVEGLASRETQDGDREG